MLTDKLLGSLSPGTLLELPPLMKGLDPDRKLYFKTIQANNSKNEYTFDMEYMDIQLGSLSIQVNNGVIQKVIK